MLTNTGAPANLDITNPPDLLKGPLMAQLTNYNNVGCGHLKLIMKNATQSQTPLAISTYFMTSFFQYMWLEDSTRAEADKRLLYIVLQGDHAEQGIIEVQDTVRASSSVLLRTTESHVRPLRCRAALVSLHRFHRWVRKATATSCTTRTRPS